ncbi:hypothetical protein AAFF_G00296050 [Aldrovandia affinis]|uniref:FAM20 C-terminal domain-containing protein n=1 Tax=Aldrovandia affinis TaxID=143900 RepID=A0AAD7SPU1_9TELE|nr:hypothetical protein AAFF_G00296050 [Aldrovandia affinis]
MKRRCLHRCSRPVCLLLACLSLALHLLLALFSFSVNQTSCSPQPRPGTQSLRAVAGTNFTSLEAGSAKRDPDAGRGGSPPLSASRDHQEVPAQLHAGSRDSPLEERLGSLNRVGRLALPGASLSKLQALFSHPLYSLPRPPLQDDDWLLKVKPKVKDSNRDSTQDWLSDSEEGYDAAQWNSSTESHPPWLRFHLAISRWQLYDRKDPNLQALMEQLATHRIVSAVQKPGGTQLKLVMSFPNYGQALLKPMKQERDAETDFNLFYFSDFERHNAEIAAFHLDRVLGFQRIPPVAGRLINVTREIRDITTDRKLARTFYTSPVGNVCFYGQCSYYCSTEHAVCGRPFALEASLAVMLPDLSLAGRRTWRSPWRRSYSRSKLAQWEKDPDYCSKVKKTAPYDRDTRLVDLIDMAILDFLMSNMDRHHYETFEKFGNNTFLLHLDNGRAFGRHSRDEPSILAPLKQCCRIRRSTLLRLHLLSLPQFRLSDIMRESLSQDRLAAVAPLLSQAHLSALDRRLAAVLQAVRHCQERHHHLGSNEVIYNDIVGYSSNDVMAGL